MHANFFPVVMQRSPCHTEHVLAHAGILDGSIVRSRECYQFIVVRNSVVPYTHATHFNVSKFYASENVN